MRATPVTSASAISVSDARFIMRIDRVVIPQSRQRRISR